MKKSNTQYYIPVLVLFVILSFSAFANTDNNAKNSIQKSEQHVEQTVNVEEETVEEDEDDTSLAILASLKTLIDNVHERKAEFKQASKELTRLSGEQAKEKIEHINNLEEELEELKLKIESIATGIVVEDYRHETPKKFVLSDEVDKLLQPIVYSLQSVTQDSREIEALKQDIEKSEQNKELAADAIDNLNYLLSKVSDAAVKAELNDVLNTWQEEMESISNDYDIASHQLEQKLQSRESVLSSTGAVLTDFFKNRGVSLALGTLAFFSIFFVMRLLYFLLKKIQAKRKNGQSTFERLTDLVYHVLTLFISILATLFIFNLRNDWLLLGISIIFLVAVGWVLIKTLPTMVEQLMILLNLGSVREGGRIVYNGVPWKVEKLHFYTHLVNPDLSGGSLYLPVRLLIGLVSRPAADNEEWFPTDENDWVKMDDETVGQVIYQSPEMVQVRLFGGNLITYTIESYLALNPMNLSHGYRIQMVFGIDYKYQSECTTAIPEKMTEKFRQDLIAVVGEDNLVRVVVDFFLPNTSSLDFEYEVFLKGSAANLYEEVERTMIYSFANVCNENHWEIPFQQITLHQGKDN